MRSVADRLRDESRRKVLLLAPADRIRLAWELGEADLALLCAARAMRRSDARRLVERSRQAGRIPSRAARR